MISVSLMLQMLLYQDPPSILIKPMPTITFIAIGILGLLEVMGKHLQYSKFWNPNSKKSSAKKEMKLSSRTGMFILYLPAFLAGLASFAVFPDVGLRFSLVKSAVTIHFLKRVLEVLFVHKYSGGMALGSCIVISSSYFFAAASMIYFQHLITEFPEPPVDLKFYGVVLFLVGIFGNFYHHYLLSKLRKKGETGYKIPKGGLFNLVLCPHYLFEIIVFLGISFICQTKLSFATSIGSTLYLLARSHATRRWYLSKFDNFPQNVKALVPYVF